MSNVTTLVFRSIPIEGQTIRTAVRPGNPDLTPLLLFSGIGARLELMMPVIEALNSDQEVIVFDMPGVGESSTPVLPYSFCGLASTVAKVLDYLCYEQVNVLGLSWGGFLAQQFAFSQKDRCRKLILAATSCGADMVLPSPRVLALMSSPQRYTDPEYGAK